MDIVKELPTVGALDDGDPEDADEYQEDHEQPVGRAQGYKSAMHVIMRVHGNQAGKVSGPQAAEGL